MKAYFLLAAFLTVSAAVFAQAAQTVPPPAGTDSVNDLFYGMGIALVAAFIFGLVYSLSKALKALADQASSK